MKKYVGIGGRDGTDGPWMLEVFFADDVWKESQSNHPGNFHLESGLAKLREIRLLFPHRLYRLRNIWTNAVITL